VVHVIRAKPPGELGGADLHVLELSERQLGRGERVLVVCLGPAEVGAALRARGIPHLQILSMNMLRWVTTLRSVLVTRPPGILHSHGYRADIAALLARLLMPRGRRWIWVVTVHGFIRTSLELRAMSWINEHVLRLADVVIAVSEVEARRLRALLRRQVELVPNGVAPRPPLPRTVARSRLGWPHPSRHLVAFVGRLSLEKRPDLFLEMAAIMARSGARADFAVLGTGPMLRALEECCGGELASRVRFLGLVPDAAELMPALDVLVCPSDVEGTPRAVIEAMLAGVPVVATRVGGVPELVAHGTSGLLVEPRSPGALAAAVMALLADTERARSLATAALGTARERFSMRAMEARTRVAYASLHHDESLRAW
jgi:glycosyltransferase involved in cell wall biosynthesis